MATPIIEHVSNEQSTTKVLTSLVNSVTTSPLNVLLTGICVGLIYLIYKNSSNSNDKEPNKPNKVLKPFPKGDLTLEELRKYDGRDEEGRVLLSVCGEIYDVTKGAKFYGPDAPYANLAGRDATRALALFDVDAIKDTWDDYSDLSITQMNNVTEWVEQFKEKYVYVGKLVKTEAEKSTPVQPADEESDDDEMVEEKEKQQLLNQRKPSLQKQQ